MRLPRRPGCCAGSYAERRAGWCFLILCRSYRPSAHEWTSGRVDEWTSGRVDEWTSNAMYTAALNTIKTQNGDHVNKLISPHFFSSRFPRPPGLRLDLAESGWSRLLNRGTSAGRIGRLGARRHVFHSGRYRGSDPSARRAAGVVCAATPAVAQRRAAGFAGRSSGAAARYRPPS